MKKLFVTILLALVAASFFTMYTSRDQSSDVPVITWRTDANPQREEQIMLFREWLVANGHVRKDKNGNVVNYTQKEADAVAELLPDGTLHVTFEKPQRAVTAGQAVVLYDGDQVLGGGVIVCPGVRIGNGAIIGAGSVVTRDIPADSVAVGNPARVTRTLSHT